MAQFTSTLSEWYRVNKRDLPWRHSKSPYNIWLSEIMLQQTQVSQGLPYYERFIKIFPTVFDLAAATEEKVLKLWQGLGYYSRARNLHHTAKVIANERNGQFPETYMELKKLKGIGDYTASAIASICFDEPVAVVDGNVFRVLSRVFGIDTPINSTEGKKEFKTLAEKYLDHLDPAMHNQAIMEFGAIQCKPKKPLCIVCPLQADCVAFQQGKVKELPVKLKKTKVRERHFNYLVFQSPESETLLQQRTEKDIWKNLYEFPLIETGKPASRETLLNNEEFAELDFEFESLDANNSKPIKHQLSHQKLMVKFWLVKVCDLPKSTLKKKTEVVAASKVEKFPVPVLIENFLNTFDLNN